MASSSDLRPSQMVHYPYPPLVQSRGADPFYSDVLGSMVHHEELAKRSRNSSLVIFFGEGAWMAVEGAIGLGMAGRGATLVLRASWFNRSSWICTKEIVALRVYDCCTFTSPRISDFRPSIKVPKSCFLDQSIVWLDKRSNLVWYSCIVEV
ncbi:hypothetical protein BHE74_00037546 [Ensete ventricosum]|nr:hypothetical protein BHE74_00037546 [Ensete ventricosum]